MLLVGLLAFEGGGVFGQLGSEPLLVAAQIASASLMFVFFFRLQAVGGRYLPNRAVRTLRADGAGFTIDTAEGPLLGTTEAPVYARPA